MFRHMDDQEIEISQIQDIQMIHFYNLVEGCNELPAVVVYYGDKKQLNLSILDAHYQMFLDKISAVYMANPEKIIVDKPTEKLLAEWCRLQSEEESRYSGGVSEPVFYPESYMDHFVVPILKYYLTELYRLYSKELKIRTYNGAWHGKGRMIGTVDEQEEPFTYNIRRVGDGEYHAFIGNFINPTTELTVHIVYEREGFRITFRAPGAGLVGGSSYIIDIDKQQLVIQNSVSINEKVVFEDNTDGYELSAEEKKELVKQICADGIQKAFTDNTEEMKIYRLPWGQYLGVDVRDSSDKDIVRKLIDIYYLFFCQGHDQLRRLSYRSLNGYDTRVSLKTYMHSLEIYVRKSTKNLIQVHYEPAKVNSLGEYKRYLSNRYYYYEGEMETLI